MESTFFRGSQEKYKILATESALKTNIGICERGEGLELPLQFYWVVTRDSVHKRLH